MKKLIYLLSIIVFISATFTGCSSNREIKEINHYILDYFPHLDKEELKMSSPYPYTVEITESQIPRSYQRNQIVEKNSINTISYSETDLWADKLYNAIPQLLLQKTNRYNFFESVQRDLFTSIPDYYIDSFVGNIEKVNTNEQTSAHVRIDFYLRNAKQRIVVVHRSNRTIQVLDSRMSSVVQTFSEIISEEYDNFLLKTQDYFDNGVESKNSIPELNMEVVEYDDIYQSIIIEGIEDTSGELTIPNISNSPNAPKVLVKSNDTSFDTIIEMGEIITLPVGKYTLYLGQGQEREIPYPIEIKPKHRAIVKPNWSSLIINIIDSSKNKVRMNYDIYEGTSNQAVGFDFSAADEAGEENRVWILEPGRYFITIDGASFSSYIDFTTIDLEKNKHYNLTIVVDPNGTNGKLLGAGIHPQETDNLLKTFWSTQNAFHLNFNVNIDNDDEEDSFDENLTLSSQFDRKMYYRKDNIDYEGRIDWELGFNKASEEDLKISVDDFRFNNTLIYNIWKQLGFYGRFDSNSHFFPKHNYFTEQNYIIKNESGVVIDTLFNQEKIKMQNPLFPLTLKEDIGLNYRIDNGKYGNINFRAGLGWLQTYNSDVLVYDGDDSDTGYRSYKKLEDTSTKGVATSIVANVNIPQVRLSWSSTADLLIPLQGEEKPTFEFVNVFNIKLIRNVSWDFRFDVNYNENIKDYFVYTTSSFIRLSYFF